MDKIIVCAGLIEPPSDSLAVRELTRELHRSFTVLIESERDMRDLYHKYFLIRGLLDYVDDLIIEEEKEKGLRLADRPISDPTLLVKCIGFSNVNQILTTVLQFCL